MTTEDIDSQTIKEDVGCTEGCPRCGGEELQYSMDVLVICCGCGGECPPPAPSPVSEPTPWWLLAGLIGLLVGLLIGLTINRSNVPLIEVPALVEMSDDSGELSPEELPSEGEAQALDALGDTIAELEDNLASANDKVDELNDKIAEMRSVHSEEVEALEVDLAAEQELHSEEVQDLGDTIAELENNFSDAEIGVSLCTSSMRNVAAQMDDVYVNPTAPTAASTVVSNRQVRLGDECKELEREFEGLWANWLIERELMTELILADGSTPSTNSSVVACLAIVGDHNQPGTVDHMSAGVSCDPENLVEVLD